MRDLVLVKLSLRELSSLPWLALAGAALTLGMLASVSTLTLQGAAPPPGATPFGDAAGWAVSGLFPAALWGGIVAGGPANVVHLLSRPISRARLILVRLLVTAVLLGACGLLVGFVGRSLTVHDMIAVPLADQLVMLCYAVLCGAVARCLRSDAPFAVGLGVLLLVLSSAAVSLPASFVSVGRLRPLERLGWAVLPVCALIVATGVLPLVRHFVRFVPLRSPWALVQCAAAYLAVLVLHAVVIGYPAAVWATLPANASPVAVLERAPDGRLWIATGEPPAFPVDAPPSTRVAPEARQITGLVLRDEHGQTTVAAWFGGADWLGLGQPGEVVELSASPDGRMVAVITRSDDAGHLELYDATGLRARHERPRSRGSDARLRWAPDGRTLVDVVVTPRALDVLQLRLDGETPAATHAIVDGERGAMLGFDGAHPWLRRDGEAVALDEAGRITTTVALPLPEARLAPVGGHLASYDPEAAAVVLSSLAQPSRPARRLALPPGTTAIRSVVWLDADHVVVLVALPTDEHQSRMLVVHVDGTTVVDVPSDEYVLDALYGPPSGPWVLRGGTDLATIGRHGGRSGWRSIPTITAAMVPAPVVVDRDGVRHVDHRGAVREQALPWRAGR